MKKEESIQSRSNHSPSPETFTPSRSREDSFSISTSTKESPFEQSAKLSRSKSLSHIFPDDYSPGEIRRIKERLLRTNSHVRPSALRNFNRSQKLTLASLALVDFMSFCSVSIMAPFFPKEAAAKQMSETVSGVVFGFYALIAFLTSPIFGKLIPKLGAKFSFLAGLFIAGVCNILFGMLVYVDDKNIFMVLCLVIRGFEALGASAFSTASFVFVVNTFPENISSVLGILETFVGLGMSTGPAIGGLLYSLGGFELPFYVLGVLIVLTLPLNILLLPATQECSVSSKQTSMLKLVKVPAVMVTCLIIVVVSSTWSFLDPTLEPHLSKFNLTPGNIGLVFLLFSGLYGIASPMWGWVADKVNNHWCMMAWGLVFCTLGLLLLGPCPFFEFLTSSLWMDLVALSILGISVALALLPTFQMVLTSAIDGGCSNSISTYSVVAGIWSCMYSLGEVIGPLLGGYLLQYHGFAVAATTMSIMTLTLAVVTFAFFTVKSSGCLDDNDEMECEEVESWKRSTDDTEESSPLLTKDSYRHYTEEKIQYYEQSRKLDNETGDIDYNQLTDIRGTVTVTGKGACEV